MSLQNPSATRLRWSSSLLEILAEPNGDAEPNDNAERQRAAASLLRLLIHPGVQDKLEAVVPLHTERRLIDSLSRAIAEGELAVSEEVVSHLLLLGPATFRGVYLRACAAYPERVRQHIAQLGPKCAAQALAMDSVFRGRRRRTFLSAETRGWLQDRVATSMKPRGPLGGPRRDLHLGLRFDRERFDADEDLLILQSAPDVSEVWRWLRNEPELLERALDALVLPACAYERKVDGTSLVDVSTMGARVRAAYDAGVDAERVMEHLRFVDSPAPISAHLLADAKEKNAQKHYRLMRMRLCLDIGDYDALEFSMLEDVFVYRHTSSFRASETFYCMGASQNLALRKRVPDPSLLWSRGQRCGHPACAPVGDIGRANRGVRHRRRALKRRCA